MYVVVTILILIVSILLGLVVLVQNSKGGGLVSNFGGANQLMGVRQTTDFLEKATWTLAIVLVVLCLAASVAIPKVNAGTNNGVDTQMRDQIENMMPAAPVATDAAPAAETPAE